MTTPSIPATTTKKPKVFIFIFLAVFALTLALSLSPGVMKYHHSDSLIPIFVSTTKLSKFYWDQTRFGMMVPRLFKFIKSPFANLAAQQTFNIALTLSGVLALFLLFGYNRGAVISGLFVILSFLAQNVAILHDFISTAQPYGVSLGLFCWIYLAFYIWPKWWTQDANWRGMKIIRNILWFLLSGYVMHLVFWVNLGFLPFAVAASVAVSIYRKDKRFYFPLIAITVGFLVGQYSDKQDPQHFLPSSTWINNYLTFLGNTKPYFTSEPPLTFIVAILTLLSMAFLIKKEKKNFFVANMPGWLFFGAALSSMFLFAQNAHVAGNGFSIRYTILPFLFLTASFAWFIGRAIDRLQKPTIEAATIGLLVFICLCFSVSKYGLPSYEGSKKALYDRYEALFDFKTKSIAESDAQFVVGNYSSTWVITFLTRVERFDQKIQLPIFGVSGRSHFTANIWAPLLLRTNTVALRKDDPQVTEVLGNFDITLVKMISEDRNIRIYSAFKKE